MFSNPVQNGRYTAELDENFVVFHIGMRFNRPWKVHQWAPVVVAMPRMLMELTKHRDKGLLGSRIMFGGLTITLVQFWRSFDDLEAFAKDPDDLHLPAWRAFSRRVGTSGDVGVFHETFRVTADQHESIYSNMPVIGLAAAGRSTPVGRHRETARAQIDHAAS
jgi:hypothetical protein